MRAFSGGAVSVDQNQGLVASVHPYHTELRTEDFFLVDSHAWPDAVKQGGDLRTFSIGADIGAHVDVTAGVAAGKGHRKHPHGYHGRKAERRNAGTDARAVSWNSRGRRCRYLVNTRLSRCGIPQARTFSTGADTPKSGNNWPASRAALREN